MSKTTIPKSEYEFYKQQKESMELKQEQTQELQEQNAELVRLLEELSKTTSGSRFLRIKREAKELLTKYNHLKSNTNETD